MAEYINTSIRYYVAQKEPAITIGITTRVVQDSVSLMRRGKRLEVAITNLSEAVKQDPNNGHSILLLACAQAERAHTLADAVSAIRLADAQRKRREQAVIAWENAQKDSHNPLYGTSKPEFRLDQYDNPKTSDDDKPIALNEDQVRQRVRELSESSLALLDKAERLSINLSYKKKAEAESLCGWIYLVLWHGPRRVVPDSWPSKKDNPSEKEGPERIFTHLEKAVSLEPENPDHALELADACLIAAVDRPNPNRPPTRFDKELFERGKVALVQAAKRRPNDGALWFFIASLEGLAVGNEGRGAGLLPRTSENLTALRKATTAFPSNALVWYTLAAAQSSVNDDEGVLDSIARGNDAPDLTPVSYKTSAPILMRWIFSDLPIQYPMQAVLLSLSLGRLGDKEKQKGNNDGVQRIVQIAMKMSKKYEAVLNEPNLTDAEKSIYRVNTMVFKNFASTFPKLPVP